MLLIVESIVFAQESGPATVAQVLAAMEECGGMARVEGMNFTGVDLADSALAHLKELPGIQVVNLNGPHITDVGLQHLSTLSQLQVLNLDGTRSSDAGMAALQGDCTISHCPKSTCSR
jgi:hypothetical protein